MSVESAADRAAFCDATEFGVSVTWSVSGTVSAPFDAIFDNGTIDQGVQDGADVLNRPATLSFAEALLPAGAGEGNDLVTVGGQVYFVKTIEPDGTGMVAVRLEVDLS